MAHNTPPQTTLTEIAGQLDPAKAQAAVAGVFVALGRETSWSADTFNEIVQAIGSTGVAAGLPAAIYDQSEADEDFWQRVHDTKR